MLLHTISIQYKRYRHHLKVLLAHQLDLSLSSTYVEATTGQHTLHLATIHMVHTMDVDLAITEGTAIRDKVLLRARVVLERRFV